MIPKLYNRKWLEKGDFVEVSLAKSKKGEPSDLETRVLQHFQEDHQLLGTAGVRLKFKRTAFKNYH